MKIIIDARYTRVDYHDGISRYTASLLTALKDIQKNGHPDFPNLQIIMAIHDPKQLAMLPDLPHITITSPTSILEPTVALQLNRYRPDIVFSPMQTIGSWGKRYKLVLTLHDLIYYSHPTPPSFLPLPVRVLWRLFHTSYTPQRLLLNRADAVVTVSKTSKKLMEQHRLTHKPITIVPNAPQPASIISTEEILKRLPHRTKDLIYMGSFMPYKGVKTLLQAMQELPDYTLHLLSKINPAQQAELEPLFGSNIVIHNGISDEKYSDLLKTSAALLTASRDEGYGLPVVEALAAGCPTVLSDIPIFREIAPSALFAQADSPQEFTQQLRALEDPETRQRQALAGRDDALAYSWEDSALTLLRLAYSLT